MNTDADLEFVRRLRSKMVTSLKLALGLDNLSYDIRTQIANIIGRRSQKKVCDIWSPLSFLREDKDVTDQEMIRKMQMLAGPYGHTLYKAWLAKQNVSVHEPE